MSFYLNLGYRFGFQQTIQPDGSIIIASTIPMHTLERRKDYDQAHLKNRLFDPQLYLAGLDAYESPKHCAKLASYPYFGIEGLQLFDSDIQKQSQWNKQAEELIKSRWLRNASNDAEFIKEAVKECIDLQRRIGCWGIILPSPLTADPGTNYENELQWLDFAINYSHQSKKPYLPIFATVAISDVCVRFSDPENNPLIELILDAISAREIDGVYFVIEQSSEQSESRHFGNVRALWSALNIVHAFANESRLRVIVNFFGAFGPVLGAVGAEIWSSGWYKSLYRLRLADKLGGGRAYPSYWTYKGAIDIHLDKDFDTLRKYPLFSKLADETPSSKGLLNAASDGVQVSKIPAWEFRIGNITDAQYHFLESVIGFDKLISRTKNKSRLDFVESWLRNANEYTNEMRKILGPSAQTKSDHVQAWLDAFLRYRRDHNS